MAKKKARKASVSRGRKTANGRYAAVNIYIHLSLLKRLDENRALEDRSRRAELERLLCKVYKTSTAELDKELEQLNKKQQRVRSR